MLTGKPVPVYKCLCCSSQIKQKPLIQPHIQAQPILQPQEELVPHQSSAHKLLSPLTAHIALQRPVLSGPSRSPVASETIHNRPGDGPENHLRGCYGRTCFKATCLVKQEYIRGKLFSRFNHGFLPLAGV